MITIVEYRYGIIILMVISHHHHDLGFVSWSETFLIKTVSGAGLLSTSVSYMKDAAIAKALPSGLNAREAMLVG